MSKRTSCWVLVTLAALGLAPVSEAGSGTLVVLNKAEATASLIDLATGEVAATLPTGEGPHEAAVSPDGKIALAANYGGRGSPGSSFTLIDLPGARVLRTVDLPPDSRPHGVLFLDGERVLATAEGIGALLIVNIESGAVEATVKTGQEISHMVAATPDGKRAFVANIRSGNVTAVDLGGARVLAQIPTGAGAEGVAVTPDGKEVWVTNRAADTVSIIDATTLKIVAELESATFPIRVALTPDGRRALVSNARSGDISVFDVASRKEVGRMKAQVKAGSTEGRLFDFAGSTPIGIVMDPGGERAYVAHANADVVAVFDLATGDVVQVLKAGKEPDGMAFSPREVQKR